MTLTLSELFSILSASFFIGSLSAYLAHRRGYNPYLWFFVGLIFGLFGVMALFFPLSQRNKEVRTMAKPEPQPYIEGPIDRFWYYLDQGREQRGPMSHEALTRAWKKGEVATSTLVWHEHLANWKQLQDLIKYKVLE